MIEPSPFDVAVLAALQGITEFWPVSHQGHLALASLLFGVRRADKTVDLMLHAGTLLAVILVLRTRVFARAAAGTSRASMPAPGVSSKARDLTIVVLAFLPTAAIGLALRRLTESLGDEPLVVGLGLLATGLALISTRWVKPATRDDPTTMGALLLGIAQGLAVFPGFSRSAATLSVALWLGLRRERAFELALLISLPATLSIILFDAPHAALPGVGLALFGATLAFALGVFALVLLRRVVVGGRLALFSLWVLPLAIATLTMARAWPSGR